MSLVKRHWVQVLLQVHRIVLLRLRIANGSGTDPATINKLLKQFKMMSEMMKKMSKGNLKGMSDKGIPPELFNQLK